MSDLERVSCGHEAYQGRCAHCDVPILNGIAQTPTRDDELASLRERVRVLEEALEPFAQTWVEAQAYADFDGADRRENYICGSCLLSEWENAFAALNASPTSPDGRLAK